MKILSFHKQDYNLFKILFIFSCYTGLPYNELMVLKAKHIIIGFDGNLWIQMKRDKTSKELSIPLLPKAEVILNKYNGEHFIFPRISNQRYNSYLKEMASIIGIEKRLTTHMARENICKYCFTL